MPDVPVPEPALVLRGRDLGEQEHDLGHRPLPPGQHLGVADRLVERQDDGRETDVADLITRHPVIIQVANLYDDLRGRTV